MDFNNGNNPWKNIYQDMLFKLNYHYLYRTGYLGGRTNQQNQKYIEFLLKPNESYITPGSSIDDILNQDSRAVLDRIKNTAFNIAYRIRINKDIDYQLGYNWYTIRKEMMELDTFYPQRDQGSERRRSTLVSELFRVYKNMFDERIQCWRDLQEPMRYFINLFHQYKGLGQDKKMLEEE